MTSQEIRQSFLDFFASKDHKIVASAPMVIKDDPTLMFTNAGMNQFKNIILGNDPIKYPRVADSQKCLRVSGKHNDLEEVGHDTYHHTMFEMLGNWSFGDYFKKEAIEWAWEYLTEVLKLDKNRLYVTVFEGSEAEGLSRDDEAAGIWAQFLPADRIINGNKKDNFWEMGDTGPCGPCSEIHIDLRPDSERALVDGLTLVNESHPQVIEIWNNVFMQFNRKADGSLEELPAKVIDTGMGFERLCMAMQGKTSNYDTDVFTPILAEIGRVCDATYGKDEKVDVAMRVIADHIRTISFSITDGQLPSNAKAGYVIRRILRRAVRYGYTFLGQRHAFMYKLIDVLCEVMGKAYPELVSQKSLIEKVIKEEEESFLRTLETGIRLLDKVMDEARKSGKNIIAGKDVFTLYDTFGFPLDLTELILRENNFSANIEEFNAEMQIQKDRARNAAAIETGDWVTVREGESVFVGYDFTTYDTEILRYRKVKQKNQEFYQLVLSQTPFYAEMGGQVGDCGVLKSDNEVVEILDTKKENNLAVHIAKKLPADVTATFTATIDVEKRKATECNHSATHLLHEALREVLGTHVEQKGSYVSPEALRFDFSHFQKLSKEEIRAVEAIANRKIRENYPLQERRDTPIAEAQAMGAMALFGEKYGDIVRVVSVDDFSCELCGGSHVANTSVIGTFRITSETGTGSGVRRIEAVTGPAALKLAKDESQELQQLAGLLKGKVSDAPAKLEALLAQLKDTEKELAQLKKDAALSDMDSILAAKEDIGGVPVVAAVAQADSMDNLRDLADTVLDKLGSGVVLLGMTNGDKVNFVCKVAKSDTKKGLHAGKIIKAAAQAAGGNGGGRPDMAQAGGKEPEKLGDALKAGAAAVRDMLA